MTSPRKIFVLCGGHQDAAALEFAIGLAKEYKAKLECWHIAVDPYSMAIPSAALGGAMTYSEVVIKQMEEDNKKSAELCRKTAVALSSKYQFADISFQAALGSPEDIIPLRGRMADLIVMSRSGRNIDYPSVTNSVLLGSGRPVLLVPTEGRHRHFNGNALIAWNGSREAMHAVVAAMPYFASGKVWILAQEERRPLALTAHDLADYLGQHDISANILWDRDGKEAFPGSILREAKIIDAGMIVMGAWGHTRLKEYLLGGVTRYMLENADIPVFYMH